MKKISVLVLALLLTAICSLPGHTGTLTSNQFLFKPSLGARGATEKNTFDAGLDRVDVRLGKSIWVGDPAIAAGLGLPAVEYITPLDSALAAIGSTPATLHAPRGNYTVSDNTVIPANVLLKPERGAIFNITDGKTLTIGSFAGDPSCQYFTWSGTGKVVFTHGAVSEVYLPWWGGSPGTANDCTAALNAAEAATCTPNNYGPPIRLLDGIWRFTAPLSWSGITAPQIIGNGKATTALLADLSDTATDAWTISTQGGTGPLVLKGFQLVGPANACKNALVLNKCIRPEVDISICIGTAEYAFVGKGCISGNYVIGSQFLGGVAYNSAWQTRPANGIKFILASDAPVLASNVVRLRPYVEYCTGIGIYLGGASQVNNVIDISGGTIEYCTGYAIYAEGTNLLNIHDLYAMDGNVAGFYFKNCTRTTLSSFLGLGVPTYFEGCTSTLLNNSETGNLTFDANCRKTVIAGGVKLGGSSYLHDLAPDTVYSGNVYPGTVTGLPNANLRAGTGEQINFVGNADFRRWQSDRPDGWGKTTARTWTKCGDGLADTQRHATPYCARSDISSGSSGYIADNYTLDANVINLIKGKPVTLSCWIYHAAGQNPQTYPYLRLRFFDGSTNYDYISSTTTPLSAATDGAWTKISIGQVCPANAVSVTVTLFQYPPTGGGSNTLYVSEPCFWINTGAAASYVPGRDDHGDYLTIGGAKITVGTAPPASGWWNQGDLRFNLGAAVGQPKGWQCTVPGTPGTWVSMGNL
jgi:hypothetical protein